LLLLLSTVRNSALREVVPLAALGGMRSLVYCILLTIASVFGGCPPGSCLASAVAWP
jgi:hypothetical protein